MKQGIYINQVKVYKQDQEKLLFNLESPKNEQIYDGYVIRFKGWTIHKELPTDELQIYCQETKQLITKNAVNIQRIDVGRKFPDWLDSSNSGFHFLMSVIGLPSISNLVIKLKLNNGLIIDLAEIKLSFLSNTFVSNYTPKLKPILLTTAGRSGSSLIMKTLSAHPEIVSSSFRFFENRTATYWWHLFSVLTKPNDYTYSLFSIENSEKLELFNDDKFYITVNPYFDKMNEESEFNFYNLDYVKKLADFCKENIDDFYLHCAKNTYLNNIEDYKKSPRFFIEKFWLYPTYTVDFLYQSFKEIILVRDFRDMYFSMLSWNKKMNQYKEPKTILNEVVKYSNMLTERSEQKSSLIVRYEELVTQPIVTLEKICYYLEIDYSSQTLERMYENSQEDDQESIFHKTSKSPLSSIGKWKTLATDAEKQLFNELFQESLEKFNYEK